MSNYPSPAPTAASSVPKPVLEIMRGFAERMAKLAVAPELTAGRLQLEVGGFRSQLAKIFGEDAAILESFPKIRPGSLSSGDVHLEAVKRLTKMREVISAFERSMQESELAGTRVFFGHGNSPAWRELKDFVQDRLHLEWDEFNRDSVAGITTSDRLTAMLDTAGFAFLIMTAEDEMGDGSAHARQNVVHEVGLFHGRLGLRRAIILLEDGCSEFTDIVGLSQIRFPKNRISACYEDVRQVLVREGMVQP